MEQPDTLLDPLLEANNIQLVDSTVESVETPLDPLVEYHDVHDSLGEPRIGVKLPTGTENLFLRPGSDSNNSLFVKPISMVTSYRYQSDDTDEESSEAKESTSASGSSSSSLDSGNLSTDSDANMSAIEAKLAAVERWTRSHEAPIFVPDHLMGLIPRDLPKEDQYNLAKTLYGYQDIFVGPDGVLGRTDVVKHDILTSTDRPVKHAPRRMSPQQNEIITQEVEKMLSSGVITPSDSPWASPVVLIRKKDGSIRFCVDYRKLNNITQKDAYPLPNIEDAVNTLCGAKFFCTLDLASGYWQVELSEEAKRKSAFVTREGLFEFNVMPFGLSNAPATFERLMELVLKGMTWKQCVVYIDDVIVFGTSFEETHNRLINVFDRLRQSRLKLKPKKCHLFKDSTLYLGYQVSAKGIEPDPAKLEAIRTWSPPCNLKGLRSFLGTCSYHRKFIPNFAHIAEPLIQLTRKRKYPTFVWEEPQQNAFLTLRNALMTEPVLSHPQPDGEFILDTDASNYAIGGALYQIQDNEERVIFYASKTLTDSQRNYCTTKRELLAVVRMVKYFRHYLWGVPFTIRTDHASLAWLLRFKDADGMLARWLAELALFQFTITYRNGDKHLNADGLSRRRCKGCPRPDCPDKLSPSPPSLVSSSTDGPIDPYGTVKQSDAIRADVKTLPGSDCLPSFVGKISTNPAKSGPEPKQGSYTAEEILELQLQDSDISPLIKWKRENPTTPPNQEVTVRESSEVQTLIASWHRLAINKHGILIMTSNNPVLEPNRYVAPKAMRLEILHLCHDNILSGHSGIRRTRKRVRQRWYWPNYITDVIRYVSSCTTCRRRKGHIPIQKSPLCKQLVGVPFQRIGMDILDVHHISKRQNRYIIVIVDYFTKWSIAVARKNHKAITCAEVIVNNFVCQFGVPLQILTDLGAEFRSSLFTEVCKLLRIHKIFTTPYRPQTDGLVERHNRTLLEMLTKYVSGQFYDWDDHLPYLIMAYNTSIHDSTGCTPFSMVYGREASLPVDLVYPPVDNSTLVFDTGFEYVQFLQNSLAETHGLARKRLHKSALRQTRNYDVRAKSKPEFKPGDLVRYYYVREKAGNKFHRCYIGPYKILSRESDLNYKICGKIRDSGKEDIRVVHVDHLIHYEKSRAELFPNYGSPLHDDTIGPKKSMENDQTKPGRVDIFASDSSDHELELQSNLTSPSTITTNESVSPGIIIREESKTHPAPANTGSEMSASNTPPAAVRESVMPSHPGGRTLVRKKKTSVASNIAQSLLGKRMEPPVPKHRYPKRVRKKPDRFEAK